MAEASIDDGSLDPDGDPIILIQNPPGPYGLGDTAVMLTVTDGSGASDSCQGTVTVQDSAAPVIECNGEARITPPAVPISFAAATDNCGVSTVLITDYEGLWINPAAKRVGRSCVVVINGETITIPGPCAAKGPSLLKKKHSL